jgi:hypothetical protein
MSRIIVEEYLLKNRRRGQYGFQHSAEPVYEMRASGKLGQQLKFNPTVKIDGLSCNQTLLSFRRQGAQDDSVDRINA